MYLGVFGIRDGYESRCDEDDVGDGTSTGCVDVRRLGGGCTARRVERGKDPLGFGGVRSSARRARAFDRNNQELDDHDLNRLLGVSLPLLAQ